MKTNNFYLCRTGKLLRIINIIKHVKLNLAVYSVLCLFLYKQYLSFYNHYYKDQFIIELFNLIHGVGVIINLNHVSLLQFKPTKFDKHKSY